MCRRKRKPKKKKIKKYLVIPVRYTHNYKGIIMVLRYKSMLSINVKCIFNSGEATITDVHATKNFKQSDNLDKLAVIIRLQNMLENKHEFRIYTQDIIHNLY